MPLVRVDEEVRRTPWRDREGMAGRAFVRWVNRLTAVGFAAGAVAHSSSWVLLGWGVKVYGETYPPERHMVFTAIDIAIVFIALRAPRWLWLALIVFSADQAWEHGAGMEPVLVGLVALISGVGTALDAHRERQT